MYDKSTNSPGYLLKHVFHIVLAKLLNSKDVISFILVIFDCFVYVIYIFTKQELFNTRHIHLSAVYAKRQTEEYLINGCYDFKGIRLPIPCDDAGMSALFAVVQDSLGGWLKNNDCYDAIFYRKNDKYTMEGLYCYGEHILISRGDTVLDIGSCIGEFAAYACNKGAICYAFEPSQKNLKELEITKSLNESRGEIIIVPYGIGDRKETLVFSLNSLNPFHSEFVENGGGGGPSSQLKKRRDTAKLHKTR
jgi:hypothetical protein